MVARLGLRCARAGVVQISRLFGAKMETRLDEHENCRQDEVMPMIATEISSKGNRWENYAIYYFKEDDLSNNVNGSVLKSTHSASHRCCKTSAAVSRLFGSIFKRPRMI